MKNLKKKSCNQKKMYCMLQLVNLLLLLLSDPVHAQKNKIYIQLETNNHYTQPQFDSLLFLISNNPDKSLVQLKPEETDQNIFIKFFTKTVISINSVNRTWLNKKLPHFSLIDVDGTQYDNSKLAGYITVINLWSTTCPPCITEIPSLNKLVEKYDGKGVIFLALAPEPALRISYVTSKYPFKYAIIPQATSLFDALHVPGYPYHIVVDREGYIRYIQSGTVDTKTRSNIAEVGLPDAIEAALLKYN